MSLQNKLTNATKEKEEVEKLLGESNDYLV